MKHRARVRLSFTVEFDFDDSCENPTKQNLEAQAIREAVSQEGSDYDLYDILDIWEA